MSLGASHDREIEILIFEEMKICRNQASRGKKEANINKKTASTSPDSFFLSLIYTSRYCRFIVQF